MPAVSVRNSSYGHLSNADPHARVRARLQRRVANSDDESATDYSDNGGKSQASGSKRKRASQAKGKGKRKNKNAEDAEELDEDAATDDDEPVSKGKKGPLSADVSHCVVQLIPCPKDTHLLLVSPLRNVKNSSARSSDTSCSPRLRANLTRGRPWQLLVRLEMATPCLSTIC